jgi:hypothetical protein
MKITLTPQQKRQLEQMHDSTRDGRVRDRIKAVLLTSESWSQTMISQALRIHESTVARHLSGYVLSEKLKPENGGRQSKLSATQTMRLIEHLTENTYSHTHQIVVYTQVTSSCRIQSLIFCSSSRNRTQRNDLSFPSSLTMKWDRI